MILWTVRPFPHLFLGPGRVSCARSAPGPAPGRDQRQPLREFLKPADLGDIARKLGERVQKTRSRTPDAPPAKADAGTLRKEFAESIERNATHGSDAAETAAYEIGYFFAGVDLI